MTTHPDYHTQGALQAADKLVTILDDNDVFGILRAFGRGDVADELAEWVTQYTAHAAQCGLTPP